MKKQRASSTGLTVTAMSQWEALLLNECTTPTLFWTGKFIQPGGRIHKKPWGHETLDTVEAYSLDDNTTTFVATMNCARYYHACCAHGNRLFVCGGHKDNGKVARSCEVLEEGGKEWRSVASMNERRANFAVVSCGKYLWALGGKLKNLKSRTTERYDSVKNKWMFSVLMLESRADHVAVAFRNKIFVFRISSAEVLDEAVHRGSPPAAVLWLCDPCDGLGYEDLCILWQTPCSAFVQHYNWPIDGRTSSAV